MPVFSASKESSWTTLLKKVILPQRGAEILFDLKDENIRLLESLLDVRIGARGSQVSVEGEESGVQLVERILHEFAALVSQGESFSNGDLREVFEQIGEGTAQSLYDFYPKKTILKTAVRNVSPRSRNQNHYVKSIERHDLVFAIGPAGTGKTYLAVAMAIALFLQKRVRRIILARPAVEAGEKLGFLPGDLQEKVNPYLRPLYDALFDMLDHARVEKYVARGIIEIAPLAFMRGRTLSDAFIILDEAQNATPQQMKMFLTRIGVNSKAVVTGDITQIDLPPGQVSGLVEAHQLLGGIGEIAFCSFDRHDVVRHPLVKQIIQAYDRFSGDVHPCWRERVPLGPLAWAADLQEDGKNRKTTMQRDTRSGARFWLVGLSLLCPPLGVVLLWVRPGRGLFVKLAASLGLFLLSVVYLFVFFGLRVERDGSGWRPIVSFGQSRFEYSGATHPLKVAEVRSDPVEIAGKTESPPPPESVGLGVDVAALEASVAGKSGGEAYWSDFRGPGQNGHYDEMVIRTDWPQQGLPLLWRRPVGGGYASVVVAQGRAFTIEQREEKETVAAYGLETGRELWTHSWEEHFQESMGGNGPRATPTWNEGRLYALGAQGELRCLEAEGGKLIWRRNILEENGAVNLPWGMSAAPLIVGEKLIVLPGGPGGQSVVAYHKVTGEVLWQSLDDRQAYTTPMWVRLAGRPQLLIVSAKRVLGLNVQGGPPLWDYPWSTSYDVHAAQPLMIDGNRFFISAGYGHGSALVEVKTREDGFAVRTVWKNTRMKNKFNSSVFHQGYVYGLDEGILACLDVETGELKWKSGRFGYGQLLLAGGHLVVLSERGEVALVEVTPDAYRERGRFAAIRGKTWNYPAMAAGRMLVRNTREMACFDIRER